MAEPAPHPARVYMMIPPDSATPPPFDAGPDGAPAMPSGEGGGPPKREKRKKKVDVGNLQTLMRNWALQYCSQIAWDVETRAAYPIAGLRNQFGNDEVRMWLASQKRRVVLPEQIVFDPAGRCGPECLNLYAGLDMVPIAGNYVPILELLQHLCGQDEVIVDWVLDWIAYPLQNPGAKMPTSIIMHGDEGSGKNLFWEVVRDIYGEYGTIVGQDQLEDKFNDWISRKLFIIGDEVLSRQEMRHLKGKLKAMISGTEIKINTKMMPLRTEANHANMVFLSNELQPNALDSSDRRNLVVWTPPRRERPFYQAVRACLDAGGREAFMHALQARDLAAFDPYSPPPATQAKADLIDISRPNPERFWLAWQADMLPVPLRNCTADQVYRLYRRWCVVEGEKFPMSKNVFARMLLREARDAIKVVMVRPQVVNIVTRMWIVNPAPEGVQMTRWAQDQIDLAEAALKNYVSDN